MKLDLSMLSPDFSDILSVLAAEHVEFIVVGAFAMAAHRMPRATGDIDVWVRRDPENAKRVWRALARFGAPVANVEPEEFELDEFFYQVGVVPHRVDILTAIDGVTFDEAWAERVYAKLGEHTVPVLSRRHLLQNKRATGRPKDLADVAWLESTKVESEDV